MTLTAELAVEIVRIVATLLLLLALVVYVTNNQPALLRFITAWLAAFSGVVMLVPASFIYYSAHGEMLTCFYVVHGAVVAVVGSAVGLKDVAKGTIHR